MEHKISWKALEYKRKEKTADWYWAVILIALSCVIISFMVHNVLFGILLIISTAILLSFSVIPPRAINISINQKGVTVEKNLYPFASLESFWVEAINEDNQKILFKSKKTFMPLVVVPLEEHHHLDIREFLLQYLPEEEMHETLSQIIMEKLGF
jgi:hypothetical protein